MTFSIVARDPQTGELGVAVESKFLAVGAVVPWAKAGVGAIATQAWANTSYGLRGLELLANGLSNAEIAQHLVVTVGTVKTHIKSIYGKLGVHSRTQAIVRANELRLL